MSSSDDILTQIQGLSSTTLFDEWREEVTEILRLIPSGVYLHSTTTAAFTQPLLAATVDVELDRTVWLQVGMVVQVASDDAIVGIYEVTAVGSDTEATLKRIRDNSAYPQGTEFPAGARVLVSARIDPEAEAPEDPIFGDPVAGSDGTFTVSWDEAEVSAFVEIEFHPVGFPAKTEILRYPGSLEEVTIAPKLGPAAYAITGRTQATEGPPSEDVVISAGLTVGLEAPQNVEVTSTIANALTVEWGASNFWTRIEILGPNNFTAQLDASPGQTSRVFKNLPYGTYTAKLRHYGVTGAPISGETVQALVDGDGEPLNLTRSSLPIGLGATIVNDKTLVLFFASADEELLHIEGWQADSSKTINEWIRASEIPFDADDNRYEWAYDLPRKGDWTFRVFAQSEGGHKSNASSDMPLNAANGYLDIAEETATWNGISGDKPPINADVTKEQLETGLAIATGGLEFTGATGFVKFRYDTFARSDLDATGGFYLGRQLGEYGFSVGNTSEHIIFDPAHDDIEIAVGSGNSRFLLNHDEFSLGGEKGWRMSHDDGLGAAVLHSSRSPADGGAPVTGDYMRLYRRDDLHLMQMECEGSHVEVRSQTGAAYPLVASTQSVVGLTTEESHSGPEMNYGRYTPRGVEVWTLRGVGVTKREAALTNEGELFLGGERILGPAKTGWGLPSGPLSRATFNPSTVTLEQLAQRVAAWISDHHADYAGSPHGTVTS